MIFSHPIGNTKARLEADSGSVEFMDGKGLNDEIHFTLFKVANKTRTKLGCFYFSPLPGCCGVVVSHHTFLADQHRGTIVSEPFRELKTALARHLGYSCMIATSRINQPASLANMTKSGYVTGSTFVNKRTNNPIAVGIKVL